MSNLTVQANQVSFDNARIYENYKMVARRTIDDGTNDGLDRADVGLRLGRVGAGFADEHGGVRDDDE